MGVNSSAKSSRHTTDNELDADTFGRLAGAEASVDASAKRSRRTIAEDLRKDDTDAEGEEDEDEDDGECEDSEIEGSEDPEESKEVNHKPPATRGIVEAMEEAEMKEESNANKGRSSTEATDK